MAAAGGGGSAADVPCGWCEDAAVAECVTCVKFLCGDCRRTHERQRDTKAHRLVALTELAAKAPGVAAAFRRDAACAAHARALEFFCRNCDVPLCQECAIVEHDRAHTLVRLTAEEGGLLRARLEAALEALSYDADCEVKFKAALKDKRAGVASAHERVTAALNAGYAELAAAVEAERVAALAVAQAWYDAQAGTLTAQEKNVEIHVDGVENAVRYTREIVASCSPVDAAVAGKALLTRLLAAGSEHAATSFVPACKETIEFGVMERAVLEEALARDCFAGVTPLGSAITLCDGNRSLREMFSRAPTSTRLLYRATRDGKTQAKFHELVPNSA